MSALRPTLRRPWAAKPARLRSMAPHRSPSLRLRSRRALRSKKPPASSLRAPLTPAATGATAPTGRRPPAGRLSRGSPPASPAHAVPARVRLAAAQPHSRSTGLRSTGRVAAPGGCKMCECTHNQLLAVCACIQSCPAGPWLAGLPRAFGTWVQLRRKQRRRSPGSPSPSERNEQH